MIGACDPGIRAYVALALAAGLRPCDSGDGSKAGQMECALPYPHVFCQCDSREQMEADAVTAREMFPGWSVATSWEDDGPGFVLIEKAVDREDP